MRLYWSLDSVPELEGLSADERSAVFKEIRAKHFHGSVRRRAFLLGGLVGGVVGGLMAIVLLATELASPSWVPVLAGAAAGSAGSLAATLATIHFLRPFCAEQIAHAVGLKRHTSESN